MQIIHHLTMDMVRQLPMTPVGAVQNDANTRAVEMHLLENGTPWVVPGGVTAAVAFRKSDGSRGLYDRLPDGSAAITIDGSTVTAILAPQALTCPGNVSASIVFFDGELNRLAAFPFIIRVESDPSAGQGISNDYYNYSTMEQVSDAVDAALASLEESKQRFLEQAAQALETVHAAATEAAPAIVCDVAGSTITLGDASDASLKGLSLYGKTTQNGTPTPASPVPLESAGESGAISVTVAGKNLFGGDALADKLVEVASATKDESAGTVMFFSGNVSEKVILENCFKENTRYTFIFNGRNSGTGSRALNLHYEYTDGMVVGNQYFDKADEFSCYVYTSEAGKTLKSLRGSHHSYSTILEYNKCGVFEGVLTEADFESYKGQTLTVSTPNGLHSVGDIHDEIDFARGVRVQRIGEVVYTGNESINTDSVKGTILTVVTNDVRTDRIVGHVACTHFEAATVTGYINRYGGVAVRTGGVGLAFGLDIGTTASEVPSADRVPMFKAFLKEQYDAGTPVTVKYVLAQPIEIPLSAQELASYAALHSNKPNTTVFNDSGAGLGIAYVADTKTYIDQKLAAISAALLNA